MILPDVRDERWPQMARRPGSLESQAAPPCIACVRPCSVAPFNASLAEPPEEQRAGAHTLGLRHSGEGVEATLSPHVVVAGGAATGEVAHVDGGGIDEHPQAGDVAPPLR